MATPPKSPPRRVGPKKVAAPVKAPVAIPEAVETIPAPVQVPAVLANTAEKPMPFVIEPEPLADPEPVEAIEESAPVPLLKSEPAPVAEPIVTQAPTPSQQAVAAPLAAAIETAAEWHTPPALEGHTIMNEAIETGKKFAEDAKTRIQSLVSDFNEKAKVAVEKSSKTAEELGDITKGNLEAIVESSKIAAKGFETLGQSAAEYGRASFEKTSATLKSFASVKSPTEFFQLQSELMTSAFDAMASETAKTSEAFLKLAGDIAQPLSSRAAVVSDKIKALAA
jgi:phasin family protein